MMEDPLIEKNNGLNDMSADDGGSSHDETEDQGSVGSDAFTTQLVQYKPHDDLLGLRQRRRTEAEQSSHHDLLKKSVDGDLDGDVSNSVVIVDMIPQTLMASVGSAACTPLSCELQYDSDDPSRTDCYLNLGTAKHTEVLSEDDFINSSLDLGEEDVDSQMSSPGRTVIAAEGTEMDFEWILLITNIVLESISAIFTELSQLSSKQKPQFALIGMLLSYFALITCMMEIIYEGLRHRQILTQREVFNNRPQRGKSFATLYNSVALVCTLGECVVTTISYCRIRDHKEATSIPLTVLSIIFAIGVLFSKILKYQKRSTTLITI